MTGNLIMSGATINTSTANITTIVTGNTLTLSTGTASNSNVVITANGTEYVRVTNTGRVGIGVTNPGYKLDVLGPAGDIASFSGGSAADQIVISAISGIHRIISSATVSGGPYAREFGFQSLSNHERFYISINNGERFVVQNTGNVGIGTTDPTSTLHVVGNANITLGINTSTLNVTTANTSTLRFAGNSAFTTNTVATVTQDATVTVDAFSTTEFRTAVYQAQLTRTTPANDYETITLSVIHDGTTVYLSQYGQNKTNASANMGTFDATIATGTLSLTFKPNVNVVTVKTIRNAITV